LRKLGEDITETLERVPAHWKVIQHVREKWTCRQCESITQLPAPSHPIARGAPPACSPTCCSAHGRTCRSTVRADYAREGVGRMVFPAAGVAATLLPARRLEQHSTKRPRRRHHCACSWQAARVPGATRDDAIGAAARRWSLPPAQPRGHPQRTCTWPGIMQAYSGVTAMPTRKPGPIGGRLGAPRAYDLGSARR
jgi:hypothetical protein